MNIITAIFGSSVRPVRLIELSSAEAHPCQRPSHPEIVIPIVDVAEAIGHHRINLHRIVDRNIEQFDGFQIEVAVTATSKAANFFTESDMIRPIRCLTREGVVGLLMKLTASRIADPVRRKTIIAFQRWAMRAIAALLDGQLPPDFKIPLAAHMSLRRRGQKGQHVLQLAAEAHRSTGVIWRRIRKAKLQSGVPLRKTRSDAGCPRGPRVAR